METYLEMQDVINKIGRRTMDGDTYYDHLLDGTVDDYYKQVLTEIVTDMTVLPIERGFAGLDPIDDPIEITKAFTEMTAMVATLFGKQQKYVEEDLIRIMQLYPIDEVRFAQVLRLKNRLM